MTSETQNPDPTPPLHWTLYAQGLLGAAIRAPLTLLHPDLECIEQSDTPSTVLKARDEAIIVVSDAVDEAYLNTWDDLVHPQQTTLLPVNMDGIWLRIGPLVIPGEGACWHCCRMRLNQHSVPHNRPAIDETPPTNTIPAIALLAAARITQILSQTGRKAYLAGSVWTINSLTTTVLQSTAVGVHGCPRCGLGRSIEDLSSLDLQHACAALWSTQEPT